ncbi:hypothetical protein JYL57_004322 [Salmonella enterica subsp. enterica serovar Typhimurium]|uniref:Uncharacterized protein n=2 Tax=Salmonella enterica TaxID=28901 RepID=A0A5U3IUF6_SALER|nr:hypothetical protein [Salmonella enterica]EDW2062082.1 hypothetical protein [Salmonella enterica subsp. enterica serovar Oslo]EDY1998215.1 hypothetical protein [Salmonella enterica subsp. diarizonae]EEN5590758.1 hypothetical protein [Salmonella enterica subsp. enterica serovar Mountpleasant]EHD9482013.1 hypothetical protein [Salmonella enterica subsp. enterica serovar Typhimurium]
MNNTDADINDTWLVGLSVEIEGTEMMVHYLISATDLAQAEAGVMEMARTWWTVTGSTDVPRLHDEWGNDWRDITR